MVDEKDKDNLVKKKKTLSLAGGSLNSGLAEKLKNSERIRGRFITVEHKKSKVKNTIFESEPKSNEPYLEEASDAKSKLGKTKLSSEEIVTRRRVLKEGAANKELEGSNSKDVIAATLQVVEVESAESKDIPREETVPSQADGRDFKTKYDKSKKEESLYGEEDPSLLKKKGKKILDPLGKEKGNWKELYALTENEDEDENVGETEQEITLVKNIKHKPRKVRGAKIAKTKIARDILISGSMSVKEISLLMAEKVRSSLKVLEALGYSMKSDSIIDIDIAEILVSELGHRAKLVTIDPQILAIINPLDQPSNLTARIPIIAVMGHVDHGKTTLLDVLRNTSVTEKEYGGITQHIGAYQVENKNGKKITFLDTPGHEAFTKIRSRGAKVTDIIVLVVAADDGIKPQTIEAMEHANNANVPIIVAFNKIDKPNIDLMKVKSELASKNLLVEELGGEVLSVDISAKNNIGLDNLLDAILLQAEILDLKTNHHTKGKGTIIEVRMVKGIGVVATVLLNRGLAKVGDFFVSGNQYAKIRKITSDKGENLKSVGVAIPAEISGFTGLAEAGNDFIIVANEALAKQLMQFKQDNTSFNTQEPFDLAEILAKKQNISVLSVLIKADTQGSLEAILEALENIKGEDYEVKVLSSALGDITESDMALATTSSAVIVGFNVNVNSKAKDLSKKSQVTILNNNIIYELIDEVKFMVSQLLAPKIEEKVIGRAEVREVFDISGIGKIAGCLIVEGLVRRNEHAKLWRDGAIIYEGRISQLKRLKDDVKEVRSNTECGIALERFTDIKVSDSIECYEKTEILNSLV